MILQGIRPAAVTALALYLGILQAAAPAIGTARADGSFRLNRATVTGNATLLEGTTIETVRSSASMTFTGGARLVLSPDSAGQVFGDRIRMERGAGELEKNGTFRIEARGLTIQPETGNSTGRFRLSGNTRVQVAALTGSFRIFNANGLVIARLGSGMALAFETQAGTGSGGAPTRLTGILERKNGHYVLTDETSHVTVEATGQNLEKLVGKRVEITGSLDPAATPVSDASQLIRVTNIRTLPGGAAPAGASAGGGGLGSTAGIVAVIGGVSVAAVAGGLAAAGTFDDEPNSTSR